DLDHAGRTARGGADHIRGHRAAVQSLRPAAGAACRAQDWRPRRAGHARAGRRARLCVPLRTKSRAAFAYPLAFPGMNVPARWALAVAAVEGVEERWQVLHDVLHVHFDAVDARPAFRAIPLERIVYVAGPDLLHHEPHGARLRALRRVAIVARQQDDLALLDRDLPGPAILHHVEDDVSAQLEKELLVGVVVVIGTPVRAAYDLDDQVLGGGKDELVADRWLQEVGMLVDPTRKVECFERHGGILAMSKGTTCAGRQSRTRPRNLGTSDVWHRRLLRSDASTARAPRGARAHGRGRAPSRPSRGRRLPRRPGGAWPSPPVDHRPFRRQAAPLYGG